MQLTIFGATGSVGSYLINEALRQGHTVIATSRYDYTGPQQVGVQWFNVDYDRGDSIQASLAGSDAAIITMGDYGVVEPTRHITEAMMATGVDRLEILTGFGTSPASRRQLDLKMKAVMAAMRPMLLTKERQDKIVRQSGLAFTIVQPPTLTFDAPTGNYRYGDYPNKSINGHLSRADLAEFMVTNLTQNRFVGESVYVQE
ncbi:NAD(P)-dependent oxidoreductase [Secundilactobacillus muriivasis]